LEQTERRVRWWWSMTLRMKEEVAGDRLLGAFLAAAVVVVLVGWIATLVYLFGFRLF